MTEHKIKGEKLMGAILSMAHIDFGKGVRIIA